MNFSFPKVWCRLKMWQKSVVFWPPPKKKRRRPTTRHRSLTLKHGGTKSRTPKTKSNDSGGWHADVTADELTGLWTFPLLFFRIIFLEDWHNYALAGASKRLCPLLTASCVQTISDNNSALLWIILPSTHVTIGKYHGRESPADRISLWHNTIIIRE